MQKTLPVNLSSYFKTPSVSWWIGIVGAFLVHGIIAYGNDDSEINRLLKPVYDFGLLIFYSKEGLKIVFNVAVILHVLECIYATYLAISLGCKNTWYLWTIQTFILGFPSLKLLLALKKTKNRTK
eukprot:gene12629-26593_t